jgi:multiple sugar transport system permease protein
MEAPQKAMNLVRVTPIAKSRFSFKKLVFAVLEKIALLMILLFVVFPIIWIILTAFKNSTDAYSTNLLFTPTLDNFRTILKPPYSVGPLFRNSLIVSFSTVGIAIPLAVMASYVFSRYSFRGNSSLLVYILMTQFIPAVVIVMPFYMLFRNLQLLDSKTALIVVNLSVALPYAIWLLKGFVDALPKEIEEAALIDGCNQLQMLRHVVFPLIAPGAITTAGFVFVGAWNEFLYAMILSRTTNSMTLTIGLMNTLGPRGVIWEYMSAVGLLVMIPVFLLSLTIRKHFVQGLTMGGVK